jgi:hypothetical protein
MSQRPSHAGTPIPPGTPAQAAQGLGLGGLGGVDNPLLPDPPLQELPPPAPVGNDSNLITLSEKQLKNILSSVIKETKGGGDVRKTNFVSTPEVFDGNRENYEQFRRSISLYILGHPSIRSQKDKILAVLSFLTKGDADIFASNWMEENEDELTDNTYAFDDFMDELDAMFKDGQVAERAKDELIRMKQGKMKAEEFFLKFHQTRTRANMNSAVFDEMLVEILNKAIHPELASLVLSAHETAVNAQKETLKIVRKVLLASNEGETISHHDLIEEAEIEENLTYENYRKLALKLDPQIRRFPTRQIFNNPSSSFTQPQR